MVRSGERAEDFLAVPEQVQAMILSFLEGVRPGALPRIG